AMPVVGALISAQAPLPPAALADAALLDRAFAWLCQRRRHFPDVADVWALRRHWPTEKRRLQAELRAGHVQLGLLTRITKADGTVLDLWSARDALVLKALALTLAAHLPRSRRCTHLQGHAGAKGAVRAVVAAPRPTSSSARRTCGLLRLHRPRPAPRPARPRRP